MLSSATIKPMIVPAQTKLERMQNDEAKDIAPLCAKRHADSDLMCALHDEERHDAVNPDGRENERNSGKNSEQQDREMSRCDGIGDHLFERATWAIGCAGSIA